MVGQTDLQQAIRKAQLRIKISYALYKTTKMSNNMPKAGCRISEKLIGFADYHRNVFLLLLR